MLAPGVQRPAFDHRTTRVSEAVLVPPASGSLIIHWQGSLTLTCLALSDRTIWRAWLVLMGVREWRNRQACSPNLTIFILRLTWKLMDNFNFISPGDLNAAPRHSSAEPAFYFVRAPFVEVPVRVCVHGTLRYEHEYFLS
eukprot:scaffold345747_cov31-Prasinocladus_malaysianus.AAC.1